MNKDLEKGTRLYEYFIRNGELRRNIVYVSGKWNFHEEVHYNIEPKEISVLEIGEGLYQPKYWKDHFYMVEKNDRKALELLIKYFEERADEYRTNLNSCLTKIKYLKFQLEEMEEEH